MSGPSPSGTAQVWPLRKWYSPGNSYGNIEQWCKLVESVQIILGTVYTHCVGSDGQQKENEERRMNLKEQNHWRRM